MALGDIFLKVKALVGNPGEKLKAILQKNRPLLRKNRRVLYIFLGAVILALLVVPLVVDYRRARPRPSPPPDLRDIFKPLSIPPEELFLPEEPDFLPEVLLERERRPAWTAEDAFPFWTDPLEEHGQLWREQGEKVIDELFEDVP